VRQWRAPKAPDEVDGVDADDFAGGEAGAMMSRRAVVGVVEGGTRTRELAMVKLGVAGGEAPAMGSGRARAWAG